MNVKFGLGDEFKIQADGRVPALGGEPSLEGNPLFEELSLKVPGEGGGTSPPNSDRGDGPPPIVFSTGAAGQGPDVVQFAGEPAGLTLESAPGLTEASPSWEDREIAIGGREALSEPPLGDIFTARNGYASGASYPRVMFDCKGQEEPNGPDDNDLPMPLPPDHDPHPFPNDLEEEIARSGSAGMIAPYWPERSGKYRRIGAGYLYGYVGENPNHTYGAVAHVRHTCWWWVPAPSGLWGCSGCAPKSGSTSWWQDKWKKDDKPGEEDPKSAYKLQSREGSTVKVWDAPGIGAKKGTEGSEAAFAKLAIAHFNAKYGCGIPGNATKVVFRWEFDIRIYCYECQVQVKQMLFWFEITIEPKKGKCRVTGKGKGSPPERK